jgi:hypothetical protein
MLRSAAMLLRRPELTCALAEEVGHYATLLAAARERRLFGRFLLMRRNEARAIRWAAAVLIPADNLARKDGAEEIDERSSVTPDAARRAMSYCGDASTVPALLRAALRW